MADGIQIGEAYVRIRPATQGFERETQQQVEGSLTRISSGLKTALGGLAVGGFLTAGIQELGEAEKAAAQTAAVIRSTGGAANVTAEDVDSLAESIANYSGKDKEAVEQAQNLLLTFRRVRNEAGAGNNVFDRATELATDLSVAWGQDLNSSAIQLGKALEDPIAGLTALRRVGVQFTADQQALIKELVASGNQLEAQKIILAELEVQVGGSAAAYGDTLPGKLEAARNSFDDLAGSVASGLVPALTGVLEIAGPIGEGFAGLPDPIRNVGLAVAATALIMNRAGISSATDLVKALRAIPIAATAAAAGVLAGLYAYGKLADGQEQARDAAQGLREQISEKIDSSSYEDVRAQYDRIVAGIADIDRTVANSRAPWDADYRNELIEYRNGLAAAADEVAGFINRADDLARAAGISSPAAADFLQTIGNAGIQVRSTAEALIYYRSGLSSLQIAQLQAAQATDDGGQALNAYKDALEEVFSAQDDVEGANRDVADAQRDLNDLSRESADIARDQAAAQLDLVDAQERLNDLLNRGAENERSRKGALLDVKQAELDLKDAREAAAKDPGDERAQLRAEQAALRLEEAQARVQEVEDGIVDQSREVERARLDVASAEDRVVEARQRGADLPRERADAENALTEALINQQIAYLGLAAMLEQNPELVQNGIDAINGWRDAGVLTEEQARRLQEQLFYTSLTAQELGNVDPSIDVSAPGLEQVLAGFQKVGDSLYRIGDATAYINEQTGRGIITKGVGVGQELDLSPLAGRRAQGGWVGGRQMAEVSEYQPEVFDVGGRRFLIPQAGGGNVRPLSNVNGSSRSFGDVHITVNAKGGALSTGSVLRELDTAAFLLGA